MDRHFDGFDCVHGGYGVGYKNMEQKMLLKFYMEKEIMCVKYMV